MNTYGPITVASGVTINLRISSFPDTIIAVVVNESPYFIQCQFDSTTFYTIPAYVADIVTLSNGFSGNVTITPLAYLTTSGQPPASVVFIQSFGANDPLTKLALTGQPTGYPIPLNRLTNIGNSVPLGTTATNIVNDGNVSGTQLIEGTVNAESGSSVTLTNDGILALGLLGVRSGKIIYHNGGDILFDGSVQDSKIGSDGTNIVFDCPDGTRRFEINNTSVISYVQLRLLNGATFLGLSGDTIARFGSSSGTGTGTFNHTLGATPDFASITTHVNGSQTQGYDSETSTNFHVTSGAGLSWFALLTRRT